VVKVVEAVVIAVLALLVLSLASRKVRRMYASSGRITVDFMKPLVRSRRAPRATGLSQDAGERRRQAMALAADVTRTVGKARVRALFARKVRRDELRAEASEAASAQAVEALGQMKGFMLKIGQMASYMGGSAGEAQAQLATLQSAAPPMDPGMVAKVVESELGAPPETEFDDFEATPIGAASVGQVHRATLGGRSVAVKVQYPGIDEAILADLANFEQLADSMGPYWKTDTAELLSELQSMRQEFDYLAEARNQHHFAELYRGHAAVQIPQVVDERTSRRVFTSEFVEGRRFAEILEAPQDVRNRVGEIIYRFAFGSILNGVFSGDPHPGNYLFPDDGRVCFIDFGVVQRMDDPAARRATASAIQGGFESDPAMIRAGLRSLGLLPEKRADATKMWAQLAPLVVGPIGDDAVTRIDSVGFEQARKEASRITSELAKYRKSKDLHGWVLIWLRYAMGTQAVLSQLGVEGNWHRIMREIVLGDEPSTAVGAAWGAAPGGSLWVPLGQIGRAAANR
jgi:predicted unusual protein kinase regulating ubiquinone biosynthesis (AarF/ABC1/UbiB family)